MCKSLISKKNQTCSVKVGLKKSHLNNIHLSGVKFRFFRSRVLNQQVLCFDYSHSNRWYTLCFISRKKLTSPAKNLECGGCIQNRNDNGDSRDGGNRRCEAAGLPVCRQHFPPGLQPQPNNGQRCWFRASRIPTGGGRALPMFHHSCNGHN